MNPGPVISLEDNRAWLVSMISDHDQLLADFANIREQNPGSTAVALPFEPGYRSGSPLNDWLGRLAALMARLRQHLRDEPNPNLERLGDCPIALYVESFNFGHGGTCEWLVGGIQEQRRLLSLALDKRSAAILGEDPGYMRDHWAEHSRYQKLKEARQKRSETQKEAADKFHVSAETYRKWEANRTPHTRYISAVFGYIRGDT
jgi:DNA-binding XRE family transcriptional regulator